MILMTIVTQIREEETVEESVSNQEKKRRVSANSVEELLTLNALKVLSVLMTPMICAIQQEEELIAEEFALDLRYSMYCFHNIRAPIRLNLFNIRFY